MAGLLDFLQSASNSVAGNVSGPVDLLGMALRKLGIPVPEDALGSSQWMERQGLTRKVPQGAASLAGETAGLLAPIGAVAKAPQIAKGLLSVADNAGEAGLNAARRGQMGGVVVGPRSAALEQAQRNAAKPISEGGLGLGPKNTPMERAKAMGFDAERFHGTPDDRLVRSRQFKNEMLGKQTLVNDAKLGHFTADKGDVASEFIWRGGSTDGGNVLPLLIRGQRSAAKVPGEWMSGKFDDAIRNAKESGMTGVDLQGVTTLGKPGDYTVMFDPKNIRSRFAAFDPAKRNSADLLGGADPFLLALLGLGAGGVAYGGSK